MKVLDGQQRRWRAGLFMTLRLVAGGSKQPPCVGVAVRPEQGLGIGRLDDKPLLHHRDPAAELGQHRQIMRDQHQRHVAILDQPAHQIEDACLCRHIQRRRRLVGDQQRRLQRDGLRDHHPLALAAGQFMRIAVQTVSRGGKTDAVELGSGDLARFGKACAGVDHQRFGDLRADRANRVQRRHRLLENHPDAPPANTAHRRLVQREQILAVKPRRAAAMRAVRKQSHHRKRRHRLAGAGLTGDTEDLPRRDRQADVANGVDAADAHGQIVDGEARGTHRRLRNLGSRWSRSPSPVRFSPRTVAMMASPGSTARCGAKLIMVWLSASIRPHDGSGGCAPSPT